MRISFVDNDWTEDQTIFASPAYLGALASSNARAERSGWIAGSDGGRVRFVLPYLLQRRWIFCTAQLQSATIALDRAASPGDETEFLNGVAAFLRDQAVDAIVQPTVNALFQSCPDNAIRTPYGSYVLDLSIPEQELWGKVDNHHRRAVKSAVKSGVEIRQDVRHLEQAHRIIAETMARSGMETEERKKLEALVAALGDNVRIFTAWQNGVCQSCAVIPFSRYAASYLYGGRSDQSARGAHSLLHWEAIRYFKSLGVSRYDFHGARINPEPGSKQDGIQKFKVRFGSRLETGYLWKLPLRPMKHLAYRQAVSVRGWMQGRSAVLDVIDQERRRTVSAGA